MGTIIALIFVLACAQQLYAAMPAAGQPRSLAKTTCNLRKKKCFEHIGWMTTKKWVAKDKKYKIFCCKKTRRSLAKTTCNLRKKKCFEHLGWMTKKRWVAKDKKYRVFCCKTTYRKCKKPEWTDKKLGYPRCCKKVWR